MVKIKFQTLYVDENDDTLLSPSLFAFHLLTTLFQLATSIGVDQGCGGQITNTNLRDSTNNA